MTGGAIDPVCELTTRLPATLKCLFCQSTLGLGLVLLYIFMVSSYATSAIVVT